MRLLFITNYHLLYGANRSLLSIMSKFKECGDDVCLLLPKKGDYSEELEKRGIGYIATPYCSTLFYFKRTLNYLILPLLAVATMIKLPYIIYRVRKFNPDIVYSNTNMDNIGVIIAKCLRKKHITHIRDFMDLDHGVYFLFGKKAKRYYILKSDGVIYVSKSVAEHTLMSKTLPLNHKVIYNGIQPVQLKYEEKKIPSQINFGIVGLLDAGKGQDVAIDYFNGLKNDYPNAILHIWGDKKGPYKNRLYKMVDKYYLKDRVIFHGFEKNADIIYRSMDVLLMCSKMEGFGRVTIEAMQRGIPVIGFNSGGTSELIIDGYNGYLFSTKDDFRKSVKQLFASNEQYNKISHQAYIQSRETYSESKYTNSVREFVMKLIN